MAVDTERATAKTEGHVNTIWRDLKLTRLLSSAIILIKH